MGKFVLAVALLVGAGRLAHGQVPDVRIKLDATVSYSSVAHGVNSFRLYNPLGRLSTAGLVFFLEPGLRAYISEKLDRPSADADKSLLDEYYIEDEGIWRLGKQYLPFGSGQILRESVQAARGDTNLIVEGLPVSVAYCDSGRGLQRGIVGRIGSWLGASFAIGRHFGINSTALDLVRRPEDAPGEGRGYGQAFGADITRHSGIFTTRGEFVMLREGATNLDPDMRIYDVSLTSDPSRYQSVTAGWTLRAPDRAEFLRVMGSFFVYTGVRVEPMVRYRDGKFYDLTLSVRLKF